MYQTLDAKPSPGGPVASRATTRSVKHKPEDLERVVLVGTVTSLTAIAKMLSGPEIRGDSAGADLSTEQVAILSDN